MEGRQLQHHHNMNSDEDQTHCDCSSEERTLFRYISHYSGVLEQMFELVQRQKRRQ